MKKSIIFLVLVLGYLVNSCSGPQEAQKEQRPNIVLIMADDMGFSDAGCYGGEIQTPNIDRLAKNGLRFTQFYNTARCCPTRASLLTGLYNFQAGIGGMTIDQHQPGYRGHLTNHTVTIAEVLKKAGYHTGMVGKWHVSNTNVKGSGARSQKQMDWLNHQAHYDTFSPLDQYPVNRGFEKFYGTIWGVVDYFDPFSLVNGDKPVKNVPDNYYHTIAINDSAAAYINDFSKDDKPFFLYVAENAPHWPIMALPQDIDKYKDTYKVGWEAIREARYKRQIQMGLFDSTTTHLSERWHNDLKWEDNPHKDWDARAMAVHAAMVDRVDQGNGHIVDALKKNGKLDNTLILFLSDNGASPEVAANYGPGFDRPGETREGKTIHYATDKKVMPGPETVYASIGPRWANVANTPLRYWKMESYEGGVRTPMIASWPAGITVPKGSVTRQVGHVMDFMATLLDLAGAKYPKKYDGQNITPLEGKSLVPIFKGKQRDGHELLFNEHQGGRYVRKGNWKMVTLDNRHPWQLFNMAEDGSETNDLKDQYPQKVRLLDSLWQDWAHRDHVLPKP